MKRQGWLGRRSSTVDCHQVGRVLQSYLDDAVEPDFAAKIAAHLEACKACGLEAETYDKIKASLASTMPEVDAEAIARLRAFGEKLTSE